MNLVDHLFVLLLFVVQPVHGAWSYRRYVRKIDAGAPSNRLQLYRDILIVEWVAFLVVAVFWSLASRPLAELGLVTPGGTGFWGGAALLVAVSGYLLYSVRATGQLSDQQVAKQLADFGTLRHALPQNDRDYRRFVGVSITAGIVEEFLYRGFAFWYLAQLMPLWAVVVVSSIAFGLGHSYQGISGMIRVTLIGLAFGTFYVWTGSIWLPMLAHAVLDILQGAVILTLMRRENTKAKAEPA